MRANAPRMMRVLHMLHVNVLMVSSVGRIACNG
jgi:hypothetical protein